MYGIKKTIVKITCLIVALVLTACSIDSSKDEASIKILAGDQEIPAFTYDGETMKGFEVNHNAGDNIALDELPYIARNETIHIEVSNLNEKGLVIEDYILIRMGVLNTLRAL